MKIKVLTDSDAVAKKAANVIAADASIAVAARGRFIMAISGGHTPWQTAPFRRGASVKMPHWFWPTVQRQETQCE